MHICLYCPLQRLRKFLKDSDIPQSTDPRLGAQYIPLGLKTNEFLKELKAGNNSFENQNTCPDRQNPLGTFIPDPGTNSSQRQWLE